MTPRPHPLRRRLVRVVIGLVVAVVAIAGVGWIVLTSSPTPGALIIRSALNSQSATTLKAMEKHAAGVENVAVVRDRRYMAGPAAALLDVYTPTVGTSATTPAPSTTTPETRTRYPIVVWIHGGGWLAGDKADAAPYFELIASKGFAVVSVNYSLAPEHHYPGPVVEINHALGYLRSHAAALHLDPSRIMLAGDSAGAQLASQVAALTTNPAYATDLGIEPTLPASALRGTVLDCGVYDASPFSAGSKDAPKGPLGFAVATLMWAYAGTKDKASPIFRQMSTINDITAAFPPTFITGGNTDPLTAGQSKPLAAKLRRLGVPVTTRFFPDDHEPKLEHEYQFDLDTADGRATLDATIAFLRQVSSPPLSSS
ncbi:MAG: alpha/beta hydrolase [Patulibacter sp.]|nr:alpha/beta hydrolase [Patulibacter sp.]